MKKLLILVFVLPTFCLAQLAADSKLAASANEIFDFSISFEKSNTAKVQRCFDKKIGNGDMSFVNTELNANITLDNGMTFYIKSLPGELRILFDRRRNTRENYVLMKEACEAIKNVVSSNQKYP